MTFAGPNRLHATTPRTISRSAEIQPAIAPTLFSHFPTSSPTTFIVTAITRPADATRMKYVLFDDSTCHAGPPMKSALAAAKYSSPGKYGRLDPQYVHPVMNAANGPKARLLQTYGPPSCGYRDESSSTVNTSGTYRPQAAITQITSPLGPAAAAVATHRTLKLVTM